MVERKENKEAVLQLCSVCGRTRKLVRVFGRGKRDLPEVKSYWVYSEKSIIDCGFHKWEINTAKTKKRRVYEA